MIELKWLFLILGVLLFLFIVIIFTKLTIYINYYHNKDDDDLKIEFRIWFGLIKFKKTIPLIKVDDNSPSLVVEEETKNGKKNVNQITTDNMLNSFKNFHEILEHVIQLHRIIRKFLKRVSVKQFEWHSVVGIGDAAHTGMITGALWAIKGSFVGLLSHYFKVKEMPKLMVTPYFQQTVSQTSLICMFQFRIGNAMLVGIKLVKFWKGGLPHLKSNTVMSSEKSKSV